MAVVKQCLTRLQLPYYCELHAIRDKYGLLTNCCKRQHGFRTVVNTRTVRKRRVYSAWLYGAAAMAAGLAGLEIFKPRIFADWEMLKQGIEASSELTVLPSAIKPSRSVKFPSDTSGLKLTLYQYQTCPFCSKVRAFLNFHGISYDIVEVNPILRSQIKFSKSKKLPILIVEDENGVQQLNDSTVIISCLKSYLMDKKQSVSTLANYYPLVTYITEKGETVTDVVNRYFLMFCDRPLNKGKEELQLERKWRQWADDVLVHTLSPNIYMTTEDAKNSLNWFAEVGEWEKHLSAWERYLFLSVGPTAMYFIGKTLKKRYRLKDDVRQSLYDAGRDWTRALGKKPFMGGGKPDLADLAVFGFLNAIEGCTAFQDLNDNTRINEWYSRMKNEVAAQVAI